MNYKMLWIGTILFFVSMYLGSIGVLAYQGRDVQTVGVTLVLCGFLS